MLFMIVYYLLFAFIFHFYKYKSYLYSISYFTLDIFVVFAILVNNLFKRLPYIMNQYNDICVWIFEFLFVIFACNSFFIFFRIIVLQQEKQIMEQMNKESYKHYEITKSTIEAINIKCHDLKHKLYYESLDLQDKKSILDLIDMYDSNIKTGNATIDYILMDYNLRYKDKNIIISFLGNGSALDFVKESDLINLLTNALDN